MKKIYRNHFSVSKTIAACALALTATAANAQITLNQASYASWTPGVDSVSAVSSFTASPSNNATWDLSTATFAVPSTVTRSAVMGNAAFPTATYSIPGTYSFNALLGYSAVNMFAISAAGITSLGHTITRQPISISSLTGGSNDSLVFDQQNVVYSNPNKIVGFPATAGSTWATNYVFDLNFKLSVAAYFLNQTPGAKRTYFTEADTVKGWGQMRMKNASGAVTGYMDVIAVKYWYQSRDSFFLNGAVAPAPLVSAFGLSQNNTNNFYQIGYYRAGEVQPLLSVRYTDATYTTQSGATSHASRLAPAIATGVGNLTMESRVNVYPNPVTNGMLNIYIDEAGKSQFAYELISTAGQKVAGGTLSLSNGRSTINTSNIATGIYYMNIKENGRSISHEAVNIR